MGEYGRYWGHGVRKGLAHGEVFDQDRNPLRSSYRFCKVGSSPPAALGQVFRPMFIQTMKPGRHTVSAQGFLKAPSSYQGDSRGYQMELDLMSRLSLSLFFLDPQITPL